MSAMLRRSSHTSTWKQPNTANSLKLKTSPSLAPLDTEEKTSAGETQNIGPDSPVMVTGALTCPALSRLFHLLFDVWGSGEAWRLGAGQVVNS